MKRQRYENAAQSFVAGEIPRIQSASLRGPLSEESGWINPWRYRPRKPREEEDWWRPGSEDMLFTRDNVMKRAAAHGLGYLSPADALAWCKASAQAEVGSKIEAESVGGILMSVEQDTQVDDYEETNEGSVGQSDDEDTTMATRQEATPSMVKQDNTPLTGLQRNNTTKATKRPVEADWLRGLYVSKRARWDGPAVSTPTPAVSNIPLKRNGKRGMTVQSGAANTPIRPPSLPPSGFKSIRKERLRRPTSTLLHPQGRSFSEHDVARVNNVPSPYFHSESNTRIHVSYNTRRQIEYIDELQDQQHNYSNPLSSQKSQKPSRGSSRQLKEHSVSDLEPDELTNLTTKVKKGHQTPANQSVLSSGKLLSSSQLRTLPRAANGENKYDEEPSFVTEVAPSSRDLQTFMFKKRRKTFVPSRSDPAPGAVELGGEEHGDSKSPEVSMLTQWERRMQSGSPSPVPKIKQEEEENDTIPPESTNHRNLSETSLLTQWERRKQVGCPSLEEEQADEELLSKLVTLMSSQASQKPPDCIDALIDMYPNAKATATSRSPSPNEDEGDYDSMEDNLGKPQGAPSLNCLSNQGSTAGPCKPIVDDQEDQEDTTVIYSPQKPTLPQKLPKHMATLQGRSRFLVRSSQITQPKHHQAFQILLEIPKPTSTLATPNIYDMITQSFNTAPSCSRKTPTKSPFSRSDRKSPHLQVSASAPRGQEKLSQGSAFEEEDFFSTISKANMPQDSDHVMPFTMENFKEESEGILSAERSVDNELQFLQTILSQERSGIKSKRSSVRGAEQSRHGTAEMTLQSTSKEVEGLENVETVQVMHEEPILADSTRDHTPVTEVECGTSKPEAVPANSPQTTTPHVSRISNVSQTQSPQPQTYSRTCDASIERGAYSIKNTSTPNENSEIDDNEHTTHRSSKIVAQSPFTEEVFIMNSSKLDSATRVEAIGVVQAPVPTSACESESTWEVYGPQSPWVSVDVAPLPPRMFLSRDLPSMNLLTSPQDQTAMAINAAEWSSFVDSEPHEEDIERPATPEGSGITAFHDLMSPSRVRSSRKNSTPHSDFRPTSTQQIVYAALGVKNPWSSSLKKPNTSRPKNKKRVSFGESVALSQELIPEREAPEQITKSRSPPPPSIEDEAGDFSPGPGEKAFTASETFSNHFALVARKFTRMLPSQSQGSQPQSSPNLGGQAEAFIAADASRPASMPVPQRPLQDSPTRYLMPRTSFSDDNLGWQDHHRQDRRSPLPHNLGANSPKIPERGVENEQVTTQGYGGMAGFDMDAALGEMNDFLGDWTVDSELKRRRDELAANERESNALKRRRLFGLA